MKKIMLSIFLIILMSCVFCNTCFASGSQTVTFACYTTTNLTKTIVIEASSNITVDWGDGTREEYPVKAANVIRHTYLATGSYNVSINADGITQLTISENDIYDIVLSQATQLTNLDISSNMLGDIDLSQNKNLERLIISNNNLTTLNANLSNLKVLECSNNKLTSLYVNSAITELYFSNNSISSINLTNFSNLKVLECINTNTNSLILTGCTNLQTLNCSNNFINSLGLTSNVNLQKLYCYGNQLTSLDISSNRSLSILNCVRNQLTSLNLTNNKNLKELYVFRNKLTSVDLKNINLSRVIVDNTVTITNSAANTLINLELDENGGAELNLDNLLVFSSVPSQILVNGVQQSNVGMTLDVNNYNGNYTIKVVFSNAQSADSVGNNKPQVIDGMIPLKHNGTNWVITNAEDPEWYNYSTTENKWANVMLRDDAYYFDYDGVTLKSVGTTDLNDLIGREVPVNYTGSMYVWIPRFTYRIESDGISIKYSKGIEDDTASDYKVHPAFNYSNYLGGDASDVDNYENINIDRKSGMWVAKYPAGKDINTPKYASGLGEISNITVGDAFSASKLTATSSTYGLTGATSHMIKNTEWGAVAYFTTGVGNLSNDSTTGNIYGIYGMNDGAEYVSTFVELVGGISNFSVRKNGKSLLPYNIVSYSSYQAAELKDIEILKLKSVTDNAGENYNILASFEGTGISKVGINITGAVTKNTPCGSNAFLTRGTDGIYAYSSTDGSSSNSLEFRNIILNASSSSEENIQTFIITSLAEEGGKISPEGKTVVKMGSNITYSMTPNEGREIIDVVVDGVSVYTQIVNYDKYSTYTFTNVDRNHTIKVIFDDQIDEYNVIANQNPENVAEVKGTGKYNSRSTVILEAVSNYNYRFENWEVIQGLDGSISLLDSELTFKMPSNDVIVQANFLEILREVITVKNLYGSITVKREIGRPVYVEAGESYEYEFDHWTATGITLTNEQTTNDTINITMPNNPVNLVAEYNKLYPVEITLGDGTLVKLSQPETKELKLTAPSNVNGSSFSGWAVSGLDSTLSNQTNPSFTMPSNTVKIKVLYGN